MIFSEWSRTPPDHVGYAIFRGLRDAGHGRVQELYQPVEIVISWRGWQKELGVAMMGRQRKYPLAAFDGEWQEAIA